MKRISVSRTGQVHVGQEVGSTPSGGVTYFWQRIGHVEKHDRQWTGFDQTSMPISTAPTRRMVLADLEFAWSGRA